MRLHQLRYFVAIAETRHFTQAAAQIRVAQPSISRQIRLLRDELRLVLFPPRAWTSGGRVDQRRRRAAALGTPGPR
jgi:DNA-binding transcriptional LysR family regulator